MFSIYCENGASLDSKSPRRCIERSSHHYEICRMIDASSNTPYASHSAQRWANNQMMKITTKKTIAGRERKRKKEWRKKSIALNNCNSNTTSTTATEHLSKTHIYVCSMCGKHIFGTITTSQQYVHTSSKQTHTHTRFECTKYLLSFYGRIK